MLLEEQSALLVACIHYDKESSMATTTKWLCAIGTIELGVLFLGFGLVMQSV